MGSWLAARVSVALGRAVHKPDRADQIPIALAAPQRPISRGFLPWRLSDDGPTSVAPSSWAVIRNPAHNRKFSRQSGQTYPGKLRYGAASSREVFSEGFCAAPHSGKGRSMKRLHRSRVPIELTIVRAGIRLAGADLQVAVNNGK